MNNPVLIFNEGGQLILRPSSVGGKYPNLDIVISNARKSFGDGIQSVTLTHEELVEYDKVAGRSFSYNGENISIIEPPTSKDLAIESVREYAEKMRKTFTGNAKQIELDGFQINSDILNLLDAGIAFADLDPYLKQKVEIEVATDDRYSTNDELFAVWREKRGGMAIATSWINALEKNTITAVEAASSKAEIEAIIEQSKATAEAKAAELLSS